MTTPDELRSDPVSLREVLLGDPFAGPGLLAQVERQVLEQDAVEGPQYRTGSVIPTGVSAHKDHGDVSGLSEECFSLLCSLHEWLGGGIRQKMETQAMFWDRLRDYKLTDVQALTGKDGMLQQVRTRLEFLLPKTDDHVPESTVAKATELLDYLLGWLGVACDHQWKEEASDDPRMTVIKCSNPKCGLYAYSYSGRWLAV